MSKKLVHWATHISKNMYNVTFAKSTIATMTPEGTVQKMVALSFHKIISSTRQTKMSREKRGTKIHFTIYFNMFCSLEISNLGISLQHLRFPMALILCTLYNTRILYISKSLKWCPSTEFLKQSTYCIVTSFHNFLKAMYSIL